VQIDTARTVNLVRRRFSRPWLAHPSQCRSTWHIVLPKENRKKEKTNKKSRQEKHADPEGALGLKSSSGSNEKKKQHKHSKNEVPPREFVRLKPAPVGIAQVPAVALPPPLDLGSQLELLESSVDLLYSNVGREASLGSANARVVVLDGSTDWQPPQHREIELYPADFTDNTQLYSVLDSDDPKVGSTMEMREPYETDECKPMQEWQTTFNPSCNEMHELDMAGMGDRRLEDDIKLFGMNGFWRNAWRYDSIGGHGAADERDTVVLKTLRYVVFCVWMQFATGTTRR